MHATIYVTSMENGYILLSRAAKRCGLSTARLRQICQQKRVIAKKREPNHWEIEKESLINYLEGNRKPGRKRKEPQPTEIVEE